VKTSRLLRIIHYWLSILVAVPLVIVISRGLLLLLKKQLPWVQPETQTITSLHSSKIVEQFEYALHSVKTHELVLKENIERIDIQPNKGIAKIILQNHTEVQVRLDNLAILQIAERRSDFIETLHDGSYFGKPIKYGLFLIAAICLLIQLITGLYLFYITERMRFRKRNKKIT
jgi:uncharacterized iron-regulated membrane protein